MEEGLNNSEVRIIIDESYKEVDEIIQYLEEMKNIHHTKRCSAIYGDWNSDSGNKEIGNDDPEYREQTRMFIRKRSHSER